LRATPFAVTPFAGNSRTGSPEALLEKRVRQESDGRSLTWEPQDDPARVILHHKKPAKPLRAGSIAARASDIFNYLQTFRVVPDPPALDLPVNRETLIDHPVKRLEGQVFALPDGLEEKRLVLAFL
jgi:hypothetical protein